MDARQLEAREYAMESPEGLAGPALLVYRGRVEQNISLMRRYLESVVPGSGFRHLAPHVKTHKSAWVTGILRDCGIRSFKCTLAELDMLLDADVEEVIVAYPLLGPAARRVAAAVARARGPRIVAQLGCPEHVSILSAQARRSGVDVDCLVDCNVGHDRTGTPPASAVELARAASRAGGLRVLGLHAYAGQNHSPDRGEREACARSSMLGVADALGRARAAGLDFQRVVVSGTPGFLEELRELTERHRVDAEVQVSPGTWIYWDTGYEGIVPGLFEFAALILCHVIDRPAPGLLTLDVGSKRWSVDQGPLRLFSVPGLEVVQTSEEHTVVRHRDEAPPRVGDAILAAPQHVCPTVNLWETFAVVGEHGRVERAAEPVTARNR